MGVQTFIRELWELDKPTVAAVNGAAVGPGAHLALACDFVIVHRAHASCGRSRKWGLVVDAGGAYLLPRLVGLARPRQWSCSARAQPAPRPSSSGSRTGASTDDDALAPTPTSSRAACRRADALARPLEAPAQPSFETDLRAARARRALPGARHHVARPRRGHGGVPGEARRALHRRVTHAARQRIAVYRVLDARPAPALPSPAGPPAWWTLPGGGIDFGEHPEPAGSASSREETGLAGGSSTAVRRLRAGPVDESDGAARLRRTGWLVYRRRDRPAAICATRSAAAAIARSGSREPRCAGSTSSMSGSLGVTSSPGTDAQRTLPESAARLDRQE